MKVLFVQGVENLGGAERYMVHLLPALKEKGVHTEFVSVIKQKDKDTAENFNGALEKVGVKVHRIYVSRFVDLKIFFQLNKVYKQGGFDCLHTQLIYADFWGSVIKRFLNSKMVVFSTKHGYHIDTYQKFCLEPEKTPSNFYYKIFKFAEKKIDKSFACSIGLNDFHEKAGLVKKGQMDIIEHGFDYPPYPEVLEKHRKGNPQLVIVGRLIELKGHGFVLDILNDILKSYPDTQLVIVGAGSYETELKEKVKALQLESNVQFLGFQTDVLSYMAASDIVLVPSYTESMPVVIFEGFNSRRPVIAFETIGCRDLIQDGETGVLVPAYDTQILEEKILYLLNNPKEGEVLARNAYEKLTSYYTLNRMVDETIAFYKKYLPKT